MKGAGKKQVRLAKGTFITDKAGGAGMVIESFAGRNGRVLHVYVDASGDVQSQWADDVEACENGVPTITDAAGNDVLGDLSNTLRRTSAENALRAETEKRLQEQEAGDEGEWCGWLEKHVTAKADPDSLLYAAFKAYARPFTLVHDNTSNQEMQALRDAALAEWRKLSMHEQRELLNGWTPAKPARRRRVMQEVLQYCDNEVLLAAEVTRGPRDECMAVLTSYIVQSRNNPVRVLIKHGAAHDEVMRNLAQIGAALQDEAHWQEIIKMTEDSWVFLEKTQPQAAPKKRLATRKAQTRVRS